MVRCGKLRERSVGLHVYIIYLVKLHFITIYIVDERFVNVVTSNECKII